MQNPVIVVDAHDQPLGVAEKLFAHRHALRHRAFSVFIYRHHQQHVEILLQQRQQHKYHSGGLWTNTCCSHPLPDETVLVAAQRRLQEEMGICTTLSEIGAFCYQATVGNSLVEHEYDHVLLGELQKDNFQVNTAEVMAWRWMTLDDLNNALQQTPGQFTPWLAQALAVVEDYLLPNSGSG